MSSYDIFALYYDSLTKNVDYTGRADYLLSLLKRLNHHAGITLDLACGTGSLTLELYKKGVDVYGVDSSTAMLSVANEKAYDDNADILFLCQKMQNLNLYGTVNTVFCCLDCINHLPNLLEVQKAFDKVSFFMEKDGYFIFDFNTKYKHKEILANNAFVYETDEVFCVWQNNYKSKLNKVDISLDFFEKQDGKYNRYQERFSEISFDIDDLEKMLIQAGFHNIEFFDDLSFDKPKEKSERIIIVAQKKEMTNLYG
ncbi:MAG: class I SAM-dependent methyltransferase [Clostridia bacterium]